MQEELKQRPRGKTILYLVPEQMTFQTQQALIGSEDVRGSIRAQVLVFTISVEGTTRSWGASRLHIDEAGVHMLLRKIVESRKDGLSVFQKRGAKRFL